MWFADILEKTIQSTFGSDFGVRFLNSGSESANPNSEPDPSLVLDWRKGVGTR